MKKIALILALFVTTTINAQPDPDDILVGNRQQPAVLLVGSFHFAYYNKDAHKTDANQQVDILSPQKQKELQELLTYLKLFKPTKIAVEGGANTGYLMAKYRAYKAGKPLGKDEREQIGFRLIDAFKLDTLYGVDDRPLISDLYNTKDSNTIRPMLDSIYTDWDFKSDDPITKLYWQYFEANDSLALTMPLLDYFKYTNSDKMLDRGFGSYLNGDFNLGDTRGADALAMHWYSRNLRIYRHLQQIAKPTDRILVIFGRGHVEILKHLFQCSPEFKLVKFNDVE